MKDDKILLVKRHKEPHKGEWAIPGGSVKLGETLQGAVEREVREETGLVVNAKDPMHVFDLIERDEQGHLRFHYVIVERNILHKKSRPYLYHLLNLWGKL